MHERNVRQRRAEAVAVRRICVAVSQLRGLSLAMPGVSREERAAGRRRIALAFAGQALWRAPSARDEADVAIIVALRGLPDLRERARQVWEFVAEPEVFIRTVLADPKAVNGDVAGMVLRLCTEDVLARYEGAVRLLSLAAPRRNPPAIGHLPRLPRDSDIDLFNQN